MGANQSTKKKMVCPQNGTAVLKSLCYQPSTSSVSARHAVRAASSGARAVQLTPSQLGTPIWFIPPNNEVRPPPGSFIWRPCRTTNSLATRDTNLVHPPQQRSARCLLIVNFISSFFSSESLKDHKREKINCNSCLSTSDFRQRLAAG